MLPNMHMPTVGRTESVTFTSELPEVACNTIVHIRSMRYKLSFATDVATVDQTTDM